jgi:hypothetical protein
MWFIVTLYIYGYYLTNSIIKRLYRRFESLILIIRNSIVLIVQNNRQKLGVSLWLGLYVIS